MATPKLTADEARAYLTAHNLNVNSKNEGYLRRIVGNLRTQEAAGVPLSLEAARGHVFTPEHPTRRRPKLPDIAVKYGDPRKSKYRRMTQPIDREPRLGTPITVRAPHVHRWMGRPAPGMVLDLPDRKILITRSHEKVRTFLRQLERATPEGSDRQWRVGFDVYDCETHKQTSIFRSFGGHRHEGSDGMTASHILDEAANSGYSLEEYLIRMSMDGGSGAHILLSHICEYAIYAHRP